MGPPYGLLVFDLDQTIFDFAASERLAFAECASASGLPDTSDVWMRYKEINGRLWAEVEQGIRTPADAGRRRFELLFDEYGVDRVDPDEMGVRFQHGLGRHGELYPGVVELLDDLAARADLAIVTNGLTAVQQAKTERLGLDRWFSPIVISEEVGVAKPDAAIFDPVFAAHGDDRRADALMIGDSLTSDMAGAVAAGIAGCWFNRDAVAVPDGHRIEHVVASLDEVRALAVG